MFKKVILGTLLGIVALCAIGAIWLYATINQDIDEHFAGSCTDLPLEGSGEDIQIDRGRKLAYLSHFDRLGAAQGEAVGAGMIMRVDLNMNPPKVGPALIDGPALHPHGISLFVAADGQRSLFVINHPEDRSTGAEAIERYVEQSPGLFSHAETFRSELIIRANDMVATGPRQFYVAQDVDRTSGQTLTDLVYFDGDQYSVVADDIQSGGGINVSADLTTLYIAETGGKAIRVATRNLQDGSIETVNSISLGTSPDNIDVAADGSLWVGAHSNVVALAMHFIVGSDSPSQILRINPMGDETVIDEIFLNGGSLISAGSGGATLGKQLLIGSITARKILLCEMN
jgi:arylesterase/paraoxonase